MDDVELVSVVVDRALKNLSDLNLQNTPIKNLPLFMKAGLPNKDGWRKWRPIKSQITDSDIDRCETKVGIMFPPIYREFLKYKHFVDLGIWAIRLEPFLTDKKLPFLSDQWLPDRLKGKGYVPFASESLMDAGPVCFDSSRPDLSGDMPIVYWDHEHEGSENEIVTIFSSTRKMFECLLIDANFGRAMFSSGNYKNDENSRIKALDDFMNCDPSGALKVADYWTAF